MKEKQKNVIKDFAKVFISIEEINIHTETFETYEVFSVLKKIIRNYSIEPNSSILLSILLNKEE